MKIHGSMTPIGVLDYRKVKSYEYLKEGNFYNFEGDLLASFRKDREKS
jgi:hypothetical protein